MPVFVLVAEAPEVFIRVWTILVDMDLIHKTIVPASRVVVAETGHFAPELVQYQTAAPGTNKHDPAIEPLELVLAHLNRLELYRIDERGRTTLIAQTEVSGRIGSLARFPSPIWVSRGEHLVRKDWLLVALEGGSSGSAVARNAGQVSMVAMVVEFQPYEASWVARAVYNFAQERVYIHQEEGIRDAALTIDKALEHVVLHDGLIVGDGMWRRGGGYGEERPLACVDAFDASTGYLDGASKDREDIFHDGRCAALVVPSWRRAYVISPPIWTRPTSPVDLKDATAGMEAATPWARDPLHPTNGAVLAFSTDTQQQFCGEKRVITERDGGIHEQRRVFFYPVELEPLLGHGRILDCCFLPGTALPTLIVLYEELPTWAGRVEAVSNTCALAAVSLPPMTAGVAGEEPLVAWRVQGLPYDAEKVIPLPSARSDRAVEQGLLVVTANILFWIRDNGQVAATLSGNHFGDVFMELDGYSLPGALYGGSQNTVRTATREVLHFRGACLAPLQMNRLALVLSDGSTYLLALQADVEAQLRLEPLSIRGGPKAAPAPLDVKLLSADLLFVAAHLGSSVLFRITKGAGAPRRTRNQNGENAGPIKSATRELELHLQDTVVQLGPIIDLVVIPPQYTSQGAIQTAAEILGCTGHARESYLARFMYQVQTREWQRIPSSGCRRVWSLYAHDASRPGRQEEQAFLLLSLAKSSVILDIRDGLEQAADSQVMLPSTTIAAGNLDHHRLIAQVHRTGIRLLDSGLDVVLEYDVLLEALKPGAAVIGACVLDPYIALWLTDYRLTVLRLVTPESNGRSETAYQLTTVFSTEDILCANLYQGTLMHSFRTACSMPYKQFVSTPWTMDGSDEAPETIATEPITTKKPSTMASTKNLAAERASVLKTTDLSVELAEEEHFLYSASGWQRRPRLAGTLHHRKTTRASLSQDEATTEQQNKRALPVTLDSFLIAVSVDGALYLFGLSSNHPPRMLLQCKRFFLGIANIRDDRPRQSEKNQEGPDWQQGTSLPTAVNPSSGNAGNEFGSGLTRKANANQAVVGSKPQETGPYIRTTDEGLGTKSLAEAASAPPEPSGRRARQGKVLDVCLTDVGTRGCPVLATVLAANELVIYKGFAVAGGELCFTRIGSNALNTVFTPYSSTTAMTAPSDGISLSTAPAGQVEREHKSSSRRSSAMRLMPFQNIQGKSGLTVIGARVSIVLGDAGFPTVHPVRGPALLSLTELNHAEACPQGFVSVATDGTVRIGQWPSLANYKAVGHFLVQKHAWSEYEYAERLLHDPSTDTILAIVGRSVPATEAFVKYLLEGNRYEAAVRHARRQQQQQQQKPQQQPGNRPAVDGVDEAPERIGSDDHEPRNPRALVTNSAAGDDAPVNRSGAFEDAMDMDTESMVGHARQSPGQKLDEDASLDDASDPVIEFEEQKRRPFQSGRARDLPLLVDQHAVLLFARHSFEVLARYELEQTEVGLSMCATRIRHFQRTSDDEAPRFIERDVLVVGTTYLRGEDTTIRGRLLVFEVSRQEGHGRTIYQMQTLAATEVKGAVSSVAPIKGGFICCSAGPRLEVYKLIEDEMSCISYYPGINLFFSHVTTLKQYILASDIRLGASFLFWRERNVSQNFLCRDEAPRELVGSEWIMHGTSACVISSDMLGNLLELSIPSPLDPESGGGTRMTFEAALHIGSRANVLRRVRIDDPNRPPMDNEQQSLWNTHVVLLATVDGMITLLCPVLRPNAKKLHLASLYLMLEPEVRKWSLNARTFRAMRALTVPGGLRKSKRAIVDGDVLQVYGSLDTPRRKEIARKLGLPQEALSALIFGSLEAVLHVL